MTTESKAIAVKEDETVWGNPQWIKAFETKLLPDKMTIDQAKLIAAKGREMGLPRMRALSGLIVIHNRVTMSAELMLGLIRERAFPMQMTIVERSATRACIRARRGLILGAAIHWEEWSEIEFTKDDANCAGLLSKNTWRLYPADMLWARCVSRIARSIFPDIIQGAILPDEARGIVTQVEPETKEQSFGAMLDGKVAATESNDPMDSVGMSDCLLRPPGRQHEGRLPMPDYSSKGPATVIMNADGTTAQNPSEEEVDSAFEAQANPVHGE